MMLLARVLALALAPGALLLQMILVALAQGR